MACTVILSHHFICPDHNCIQIIMECMKIIALKHKSFSAQFWSTREYIYIWEISGKLAETKKICYYKSTYSKYHKVYIFHLFDWFVRQFSQLKHKGLLSLKYYIYIYICVYIHVTVPWQEKILKVSCTCRLDLECQIMVWEKQAKGRSFNHFTFFEKCIRFNWKMKNTEWLLEMKISKRHIKKKSF